MAISRCLHLLQQKCDASFVRRIFCKRSFEHAQQIRNVNFQKLKSPVILGDRQFRSVVEALEQRYLFACTTGNEIEDAIESQIRIDYTDLDPLPLATLSLGLGDFRPELLGGETVVTGLNEGDIESVSVLTLEDNRYMIAWVGDYQGTYGVFVRPFRDNGGPLGAPRLIHEIADPHVLESNHVELVRLSDGEFGVLWRDHTSILGQRVACDLQLVEQPSVVVPNASYFVSEFSAISRRDGGLVLAWENDAGQKLAQGFNAYLTVTHDAIMLPIAPGDSLLRLLKHPTADFAISHYENIAGSDVQHLLSYDLDGSQTGTALWFQNDFPGSRPLLVLEDGKVATLRPDAVNVVGESAIVLDLYTSQGEHLASKSITQTASLENVPQVVGLDNGSFAVSYVEGVDAPQAIHVRQFNANGETIGSSFQFNVDPIQSPAKYLLAPLLGGGFALQWKGFALDGQGATLVTRTFHQGVTPIAVQALNIPELTSSATVQLDGLPADASLNRGSRNTQGAWHLNEADLDSLVIISSQQLPLLKLEMSIVDVQSLDSLDGFVGIIGTELDDEINGARGEYVFGGDGTDTLFVEGYRSDYQAIDTEFGFQLWSQGEEFHPDVIDVEYVAFEDGTWASDVLLQSSDDALGTSGDSSEPSGYPPVTQTGGRPDDVLTSHIIAATSYYELDTSVSRLVPNQQESNHGNQTESTPEEHAKLTVTLVDPLELAIAASNAEISIGDASELPNVAARSDEVKAVNSPASSVAQKKLPPAVALQPKPRFSKRPWVEPVKALGSAALDLQSNLASKLTLLQATEDVFASSTLGLDTVFDTDRLFSMIDAKEEEPLISERMRTLIVGTSVVFAAGFSLAHVVWVLRSTIVLTKMMSALPVWVGFDPLLLLESLRSEEDEETLLDIAVARATN